MINHEYQFIFSHIPKTAGTSLEILNGEHKGAHRSFIDYINKSPYAINYFKFSFVRNPWDRFASIYNYYLNGSEMYGRRSETPFVSFVDFTRRFSAGYPMCSASVSENLHVGLTHYYPLLYFLTINNSIDSVDFIGRFENLQEDFNIACDKIGIPQQELPHINRSPHQHYTEYYDDETRNVVAWKYKEDIECFGYKFGD
jgi:hypothetical protein